jgi:hypothetical protein
MVVFQVECVKQVASILPIYMGISKLKSILAVHFSNSALGTQMHENRLGNSWFYTSAM